MICTPTASLTARVLLEPNIGKGLLDQTLRCSVSSDSKMAGGKIMQECSA